jgi:mycothiol system anti-sigma-R factor
MGNSPDPAPGSESPSNEAFDPCAGNPECQQALAELYSYLDGELTVEKRTVIRTHLDLCPPCGDQFSFETELRQVISMRCQEKVPEALRLRVAEALRRELGGG